MCLSFLTEFGLSDLLLILLSLPDIEQGSCKIYLPVYWDISRVLA